MPSARTARAGGFSAFEKFQRPAEKAASEEKAPAGAAPKPAAKPKRELDVAEVKRLLEDLRAAIVGAAFQKALSSVRSKDWGALKKRAGVAKLLSYAWKAPLKASGFAIDGLSFPHVLAAVRQNADQPGVKSLTEEVERLLMFHAGALFGSRAGSLKASPNNAAAAEVGSKSKEEEKPEPPAPPPAAPARTMLRGRPMGLGEAKDILKRLKEECMKPEFQQGLADLSKSHALDSEKLYSNFVCKRWAEAVRFYDFPVTPGGFKEMADGIMRCAYNRHVEMLAHEVEEKLHVPLGSFFNIAPPDGDEGEEDEPEERPKQEGEVTVLLRHNQDGTELKVDVPKTATFWDLKEAAARLLGRDAMKTRGRLVRKSPGSTFVSYKDSDLIGAVREVLVLGCELNMETDPIVEAQKAAQKAVAGVKPGSMRLRFEDMSPVLSVGNRVPVKLPQFSKEKAKQLLTELHSGYKDPDFQHKLQQFHATLGATAQFAKERQRMALSIQSEVLPKYGLRGNMDGVLDLQKVMTPFMEDQEMKKIAMECDDLLLANTRVKKKPKSDAISKDKGQQPESDEPGQNQTDPEPEPPSKPDRKNPSAPPKEVIFVVRHALNEKDEDIKLTAMSSSTFKQIKHVLAEKLGNEEVKTKARFVHKDGTGGVWVDFPDEEEIGRTRTELRLLGVSLPPRETTVTVKHAINEGTEVRLDVQSNWKFIEVKEALANKLGRPEIKKVIRFVFRPAGVQAAGAWASWKDEEKVSLLGSNLQLNVIGVDTLDYTLEARRLLQEEEERKKAADPKLREEAARKAKEEVEAKAQAEAKRKAEERKKKKMQQAAAGWMSNAAEWANVEMGGYEDARIAEEKRKEEERKAQEEADRILAEMQEKRRQEEAEQKRQEELQRKTIEEEAERQKQEDAERRKREEEEAERRRQEEEALRKKKEEEEERSKREEAEIKKRVREAELQKEEERRAREKAERQKQEEEAERKLQEEVEERKRADEERRKAKREAELREEEAERAKEEAELRAKEEAKLEAEKAERKAREEAELRAKREAEEAELKARQEREEAERRAKEEAERAEAERAEAERAAAERKAREEAERQAKEEAEKAALERKAQEEAERRAAAARVEALRKEEARKEAELKAQREAEEAELKAKQEREEAEQKRLAEEEEARRRDEERREEERKEEERREQEKRREEEIRKEESRRLEEERRREVDQKRRQEDEEEDRRRALSAERRQAEEEAFRKASVFPTDEAEREEEMREEERQREEKRRREQERIKKQREEEEAQRRRKEEEKKAKEEAARKVEEARKAKEEAAKKAQDEAARKAKEEAEKKAAIATQPQKLAQKDALAMAKVRSCPDAVREDESSQIWIVVGGEEKGGILVRKGEGYDSKPFPIRLQTGSRIEELTVVGNRLHYKRLVGDGPDYGWVNILLNEKVLVEHYKLAEKFAGK